MKIMYASTQSNLKRLIRFFLKPKIRQVIIILIILLSLALLFAHTTPPATIYPQVFP